jgi:hypothetical protein
MKPAKERNVSIQIHLLAFRPAHHIVSREQIPGVLFVEQEAQTKEQDTKSHNHNNHTELIFNMVSPTKDKKPVGLMFCSFIFSCA